MSDPEMPDQGFEHFEYHEYQTTTIDYYNSIKIQHEIVLTMVRQQSSWFFKYFK